MRPAAVNKDQQVNEPQVYKTRKHTEDIQWTGMERLGLQQKGKKEEKL